MTVVAGKTVNTNSNSMLITACDVDLSGSVTTGSQDVIIHGSTAGQTIGLGASSICTALGGSGIGSACDSNFDGTNNSSWQPLPPANPHPTQGPHGPTPSQCHPPTPPSHFNFSHPLQPPTQQGPSPPCLHPTTTAISYHTPVSTAPPRPIGPNARPNSLSVPTPTESHPTRAHPMGPAAPGAQGRGPRGHRPKAPVHPGFTSQPVPVPENFSDRRPQNPRSPQAIPPKPSRPPHTTGPDIPVPVGHIGWVTPQGPQGDMWYIDA